MLYLFFLLLAIAYNVFKFSREREYFLSSLKEVRTQDHRNMILAHHFHIFMFEASIGMIAAILLSDSVPFGIVVTGLIYIGFVFFGLYLYQYFLKYLEKKTLLCLRNSFNDHFVKEFRVSFSIMFIPILLYSVLNWTFQENNLSESTGFAFIEMILNIIFVSVLTIFCTVAIMLKLIPHRDIVEEEYRDLINKRLEQIGLPHMRVKWIETDIRNAFIVGIQLWRFSNQTMFIGKKLRELLTLEEFDAVVAHELSHVANRHVQKRVVELIKTFLLIFIGSLTVVSVFFLFSFFIFDEDLKLHLDGVTIFTSWGVLFWFALSYSFYFDILRSHEFEADAYAVLNLRASHNALISALEKISKPDETAPDYLKKKQTPKKNRFEFITKFFTTHPSLEERERMLQLKIMSELPFDHYVSLPSKMRGSFKFLFNWKFIGSTGLSFSVLLTWMGLRYSEGQKLLYVIHHSDSQTLMKDEKILNNINRKPRIFGPSLMHAIVKKQDQELIEFYLKEGANPARTLIYLTETKNLDLFKHFYTQYEAKLKQEEYFLVLLKSAELNFTDGYRYLVNAPRFENLKAEYKMHVADEGKASSLRRPASVEK